MPQIIIQGVDELVEELGQAAAMEVLRPPMERGVSGLRRVLATYPARVRRSMAFQSERQRRFFFWALRRGLIEVPYRRMGTLGRSWTTEVTLAGDTLTGEVGNNVGYGPYVQGEGTQAQIHQGVWQTDQDAVDLLEGQIVADFEAAIQAALGGG